jgi:hypothetical protein
VIEAVVEDEGVKRSIFQQLDKVLNVEAPHSSKWPNRGSHSFSLAPISWLVA